MKINFIEIVNFRNLEKISVDVSPHINLLYGENGSGKTSFLEAIHYLALGRSFRTRNLARIIHHHAESFSLFSQLFDASGLTLPVGIARTKGSSQFTIRIGGKPVNSLIELAALLPVQLITADSHLLLTSGPGIRRQFLDWGVFHVEPSFYYHWQRANRILKQRNASLKNIISYSEISLWDDDLQIHAASLDTYRQKYISQLQPIFNQLANHFLERGDIEFFYLSGWNTGKSLKEVLTQSFARDRQLGFTQQGPHRADWLLKIGSIPATDILSQGQLKLAAYALRLAQGRLLEAEKKKATIFLIDDLPSELDLKKRKKVAETLRELEAQMFITGITRDDLADLIAPGTRTFHVEQGRILEAS